MNNAEVSGAPCPLEIYYKGEVKELLATPFKDKDYDELDSWIQAQTISIARHSLRLERDLAKEEGGVVEFDYEEEMQAAYKASLSISIYESSGSKIVNTPKGAARIGWMMCREKHPEIPYSAFVNYCRNWENQAAVMQVFATLNPHDARVSVDTEHPEDNAAKNE